MHMVFLYVDFQHFYTLFLFAQAVDLLRHVLTNFVLQNLVPTLRTEDDVILALI